MINSNKSDNALKVSEQDYRRFKENLSKLDFEFISQINSEHESSKDAFSFKYKNRNIECEYTSNRKIIFRVSKISNPKIYIDKLKEKVRTLLNSSKKSDSTIGKNKKTSNISNNVINNKKEKLKEVKKENDLTTQQSENKQIPINDPIKIFDNKNEDLKALFNKKEETFNNKLNDIRNSFNSISNKFNLFVDKLNKTINQNDQKIKELSNKIDNLNQQQILSESKATIGCDEVGLGEPIGPMITCAALVKDEYKKILLDLGVKDSKKIGNTKIHTIYEQIKPYVKYVVYEGDKLTGINHLITLFNKNMSIVQVYMHNETLLMFKNKYDINCPVVLDKFCEPNKYNEILDEINVKEKIPIEIMKSKAESDYVSVAAASIIARHYYLKRVEEFANLIQWPKDKWEELLKNDKDTRKKLRTKLMDQKILLKSLPFVKTPFLSEKY
ncbi:hypothetical protein [Mycoplasma bradburyae]|uniref:hypothetical protein n=1 Tax=Mycoplasma bradburyae TaxID=2963128 RepID=UPI002FF244C4